MEERALLVENLKLHINTIAYLKDLSAYNINFKEWQKKSEETLEKAFGVESEIVKGFRRIRFLPPGGQGLNRTYSSEEVRRVYVQGLEEAGRYLLDFIKMLDDKRATLHKEASQKGLGE